LVTPTPAVAAAVVGASTAAVLFCSHFHQAAGDAAAGKKSPLVRLGGDTAAAARLLSRGVVGVYGLLGLAALAGWLPVPASLAAAALSAAPGRALLARAAADHALPARSRTLKLAALDWHAGLGAGLALGLAGPAVLASARAAGVFV
jgi:1,4-dihydroxy-2-naphthoate octaprenyltransferase